MTARSAARLGVPGLLTDRDLRHRVIAAVGDPDVGAVKGHPIRAVTDGDGGCDYTARGHNLRHRVI